MDENWTFTCYLKQVCSNFILLFLRLLAIQRNVNIDLVSMQSIVQIATTNPPYGNISIIICKLMRLKVYNK
jgi:hypothetical protein